MDATVAQARAAALPSPSFPPKPPTADQQRQSDAQQGGGGQTQATTDGAADGTLTFAQRKWLEAEFAKKIELKDGTWKEFQTAITKKWSDRSIKTHVERVYGDISGKGAPALERAMDKRIRQLFDAVVASG